MLSVVLQGVSCFTDGVYTAPEDCSVGSYSPLGSTSCEVCEAGTVRIINIRMLFLVLKTSLNNNNTGYDPPLFKVENMLRFAPITIIICCMYTFMKQSTELFNLNINLI